MSNGDKKRIEIRDRDLAILRTLFECRVMTRLQAAILHFDGKVEAAKKRLQSLKAAGYVNDRPRLPHEPAVLTLAQKGFALLQARGALDGFDTTRTSWKWIAKRLSVSPLTLQHELGVMGFRAAIIRAVRQRPKLSIAEICTWPAMIAFEASGSDGQRVEVRPDGFFRLIESAANGKTFEHSFYVEVDRSTESQKVLAERIRCYYDFYHRGGFAILRGKTPQDYKSVPFRLLVTCHSKKRRDNLAEQLLNCPTKIGALAWITTSIEATDDPLGAIWLCPVTYRTSADRSLLNSNVESHPFRADFKNNGFGG